MRRLLLVILVLPSLLFAQEFEFQQEIDTIPIDINGWEPFQPWVGGYMESHPDLCDIDTDGDFDLFLGLYSGYIDYFMNEGTSSLPNFTLYASNWDSISCFPNNSRSNPEYFDLDKVKLPLNIRFRRSGDRFVPLGMDAEKKIGKFLTAQHIPHDVRRKVIVVEDREKIIWVWPVRISERAKVTTGTRKILQLQIMHSGDPERLGPRTNSGTG